MARSSSAVNGSSSSSTSGSCRNARPTARRWRMPRENSRARPSRTRAETHALQHFIGALAGIGQAVEPPEQRQVFDRGELVVERDAMPQNADASLNLALNLDRPARRPRKSGDDPQQSGLAGSVAAQQGQGGSGLDVQSHFAEGRKVAVVFPDVGDFKRVHAFAITRALAEKECAAQRQDSEGQAQDPIHPVVNLRQDFRGLRLAGVFLRTRLALALADRPGAFDLDVEGRRRHLIQAGLNVRFDSGIP